MPPENLLVEMKHLLEKNTKLLEENQVLLKKMHRSAVWGMWIRIIWYVMLVGLPFALYFYVLEPYFTALGSSYEVFSTGMQEIPGWKQFNETLNAIKNRNY
jgi:hypothetical protein